MPFREDEVVVWVGESEVAECGVGDYEGKETAEDHECFCVEGDGVVVPDIGGEVAGGC